MEELNNVIKRMRKDLGRKLEDGDDLYAVCKDGIVRLSMEGKELKVEVILGEPFVYLETELM